MRLFFALLVPLMAGCYTGIPISELGTQPHPEVVVAKNSDPIPQELLDHIIRRTDGFCREDGRQGVKRVTILHKQEERTTSVSYLCIGEVAHVSRR